MAGGYDFPLEILVARELAREGALRSIPGQAAGSVAATVRDLLDAGLEADHLEGLEELLGRAMAGISDSERLRALGLARITIRVRRTMENGSFRLDGTDLQIATECLSRGGFSRPITCSSVIVFGFADVTGAAGELLSALLRRFGGTAIVDQPPSPGDDHAQEEAYPRGLLERLSGFASARSPERPDVDAQLSLFVAGEPWIEVHALAEKVHAELEAGIDPEEIAIVFRDPGNYSLEIRRCFRRLGIPFSASAITGPSDPDLRPWRAMLDLLEGDLDPPTERWLGALHSSASTPWEPELALAIRVLGTGRLSALARLPRRDADLALPIRDGLAGDVSGGSISPRSRLPAQALERLRQLAKDTLRLLQSWPRSGTFAVNMDCFGELAGLLGWPEIPHDLLYALARSAPRNFELGRGEFRKLAGLALSGLLPKSLGGQGGGVQVLTVMEARSRRFSRLFVAGMQRGAFPRPVREDALLSDSLRKQIRHLLPDLPVKALGHDEDRYLFAQLLTAAAQVTLSWCHRVDSKGKLPSPLVESLLRVRSDLEVEAVEPPSDAYLSTHSAARPFEEHLMSLALGGNRDRLAFALPAAWPQLASELPGGSEVRGASARLDLLAAMDSPFPDRISRLPFLGFVGPARGPADPRHRGLAVTTVEGLVTCPWQTFLTRLLRLQAPPDPLASLPALDPLRLGNVVHRTLESLIRQAGPSELESGRISWPSTEDLEELAFAVAVKLLEEEGSSMEGLARGLARLALPYLEVARQADWTEGVSRNAIVGVEIPGQVVADPGYGDAALEFRADRVDRLEDGLLRTDYKTGKPLSQAKQETTRRRHLLNAVLQGRFLQIVAYCLTGDSLPATGRLLFLGDKAEDEHRSIQVTADEPELIEAYRQSVAAAADALRVGALFPRLTRPDGRKESDACSRCGVSEACVRGDSGARQDLLGLVESGQEDCAPDPDRKALSDLWHLTARKEAKA